MRESDFFNLFAFSPFRLFPQIFSLSGGRLLTMPSSSAKGRGLIAAPGYRFILAGVVLILLGVVGGWPWLTGLGVFCGGFFAYFFRDPERDIPPEPGVIVSPADGVVVRVDEVQEDEFPQEPGPVRGHLHERL